jgi:tetratricopeptide (TPR) repeat protein
LLERARSGSSNKLRCLTLSAQAEAALGNKKNAEKACDLIIELAKEARAIDATIESLAFASVYFQNSGNEKKFLQAKELLTAKMQSPKAPFYANSAALERLGDSSKSLSRVSEAVSYYQRALKYSSAAHKEKIDQKIADCKKNKR